MKTVAGVERSQSETRSSACGDWILQIEDLREQLIVNVNRKDYDGCVVLVMAGDVAARSEYKSTGLKTRITDLDRLSAF
jgi:hypothetical protein